MAAVLNHDVLIHALSVSDSLAAAMSLMATCRFLYHEGARIVLTKPIKLVPERCIVSFLAFLQAEDGTRLRHLRGLRLHAPDTSSEVMTRLASAIHKSDNLETLELQ
ncbi:hypothetical protein C8T65DRAFT_763806 [Cerioporus squamosus]|nr:hypothetical protein C8T65DRAFT_763806 [Cerioporus squamosus]